MLDVATLTLGPILDAIVAKQLGWRIVMRDSAPFEILGGLPPSSKPSDCFVKIPAFSTSMTPAWALVTRKLTRFQLTQIGDGANARYSARSAFNDPIDAETGPLAVCFAFLRAERVIE